MVMDQHWRLVCLKITLRTRIQTLMVRVQPFSDSATPQQATTEFYGHTVQTKFMSINHKIINCMPKAWHLICTSV